jgi:hypothetical protein
MQILDLEEAAENRKSRSQHWQEEKVTLSIIETFGGSGKTPAIPVKDVEQVLRLEYQK